MNRTFFLRTHPVTRISHGKRLIDLNMGVTHRHELNRDAPDDSPTNEGPEVAEEDVIFVLGVAVVHLTGQVIDERLRPGRDVLLGHHQHGENMLVPMAITAFDVGPFPAVSNVIQCFR